MSDLVERLRGLHVTRHPSRCVVECDETTILEAAAEIERLRAALREIASDDLYYASGSGHESAILTARAALEGK